MLLSFSVFLFKITSIFLYKSYREMKNSTANKMKYRYIFYIILHLLIKHEISLYVTSKLL